MNTTYSQRAPSPFSKSYKDIFIVNSNYAHYGQSVLPSISRSILPHRTSSTYSHSTTYSNLSSTNVTKLEDVGSSSVDLSLHNGSKRSLPIDHYSSDQDQDLFLTNGSNDGFSSLTSESHHNSTKQKRAKFSYRSLLSGPDNRVKKFLTKLQDNDNFSIFSSKSLQISPTINTLPTEVLKLIIYYTNDYRTLIHCLYVNKSFNKAVKPIIYKDPYLTSTYRLAQLISSLRENPNNGKMILELDLSKLTSGLIEDNSEETEEEHRSNSRNTIVGAGAGAGHHEDEANLTTQNRDFANYYDSDSDAAYRDYAYASWRDWKYKGDLLYGSSLLNSYNLSKSKSTVSVDTLSTVTSVKLKLLNRLKPINEGGQLRLKLKLDSFTKLFSLKKKNDFSATKLKRKVLGEFSNLENETDKKVSSPTSNNNGHSRTVKFGIVSDPKNQPFVDSHPYTNKFLLKYSGSKDIPIGYVLYFIDLCPNLTSLNLSGIAISSDFKTVEEPSRVKVTSLVEDVLKDDHENSKLGAKITKKPIAAHYLSDQNASLDMKTFHKQFVKIHEHDIIDKLTGLEKLQHLKLSSILWLNYRTVKKFTDQSKSIKAGVLKSLDLSNSGMMRNLNWALEFNNLNEITEFFKGDTEPRVQSEEHHIDSVRRTIGMNY